VRDDVAQVPQRPHLVLVQLPLGKKHIGDLPQRNLISPNPNAGHLARLLDEGFAGRFRA
jgi:hypothetical protein